MKADVELQIGDLKYQNEIDAKNYQSQLDAYRYNQSRMDTFAMAEFEARNKELATQRQFDNQKALYEFQQELAAQNKQPSKYEL